MRNWMVITISVLILFSTQAHAQTFSRVLKEGMYGEDVRNLQVFLNKSPETSIAAFGAGSPGKETYFFGNATKQALVRFQERYKSEILTPFGLSGGTGILGQKTKEKIIQLSKSANQQSSSFKAQVYVAPAPTSTTPEVSVIEKAKEILKPFPLLSANEFIVTSQGVSSYADFYAEYAKIAASVSFSESEYKALKKKLVQMPGKETPTETVLAPEELIDLARSGTPVSEILPSLKAWANLNTLVKNRLMGLATNSAVFETNRELSSWFAYSSDALTKLATEKLSANEIDLLYREYEAFSKIHNLAHKKSVAKAQKEEPKSFALINRAEAFTCATFRPPLFYDFGGYNAFYEPCLAGIVNVITTPCGGLMFFSYATMTISPFMAKWGPWVISAPIMGRSIAYPGACPTLLPPFVLPYEAVVIYYGAASL